MTTLRKGEGGMQRTVEGKAHKTGIVGSSRPGPGSQANSYAKGEGAEERTPEEEEEEERKRKEAEEAAQHGGEAAQPGEGQPPAPPGKPGMPPNLQKTKKSLSEADLQKSLDRLSALATEQTPVNRRETLLDKAKTTELSKSENEELFQLLGGGSTEPAAEGLSEEVTKGLQGNERMQEALDVSNFLQEQNNELVKSLSALGEFVEASSQRQHNFNVVLAKAIVDEGNFIQAISKRLGIIESQPARGPKARGVSGGQPLSKSFAGQPGGSDELTKAQIFEGLEILTEESMAKGMNGFTEGGEDLTIATSKFEQFNAISPQLLDEVKAKLQERRAASH